MDITITLIKQLSLTSQPFWDIVIRCEPVSVPESPRRWILLLVESAVAAALEWFPVQLTVRCWKEVWLWNRRNLSWTTSRPAYSNWRRQKTFTFSQNRLFTVVRHNKCSSLYKTYLVSILLLTKPLERSSWLLPALFPAKFNLQSKVLSLFSKTSLAPLNYIWWVIFFHPIIYNSYKRSHCLKLKIKCTCDFKGSIQVVPPAVKLQKTFTASQGQPWLGSM